MFLALSRGGISKEQMNIEIISVGESESVKMNNNNEPKLFSQQSISLLLELSVLFHEARSELSLHVDQRETLLIHRHFRYWALRLDLMLQI